jgi:hypothetical protein
MPLWVAISADLSGGSQATVLVEFTAPEQPPNLLFGFGVLQVESPYPNPEGGLHLSIPGAGRGFSIDYTETGVMLNLPHRRRAVPIFGSGATLISVAWLDQLPEPVQGEVTERYRALERIRISPESSRVDGDLNDWSNDEALPVDSASNILTGAEHWSGPRDASFGVAAHLHRGRLEVGVRIRDDDVLVGRDKIEIETEHGVWTVPLKDRGVYTLSNGAEVAFTEQSGFGVGMEFGVPMGEHVPSIDRLPVIVRYLDVDALEAIEDASVISTAPSMAVLLQSLPL